MPPRIARSSVPTTAPNKSAKNKSRKRNLDAYSIAAHSIKPSHVPKHRLGEVEDSGASTKRRRADDDDDDDGGESEEDMPKKKVKGSGMMGEDGDGVEEGEDSEGNEWRMGGLREGDEESDLDSEEAFGSSDEERFEGFTFRGSSTVQKGKKVVRKRAAQGDDGKQVDLNEEEPSEDEGEEEASDGFGDEGVDLATMLDGDNASDPGDDDEDESGSGSSDDSNEDDANSESESDSEPNDAEGEEERIARLHDRIDTLSSRDRPATTPTDEPADENGLLPMDDLYADIMADLNPEEKKQHLLASMKKKSKSKLPKALTAPLPKRQQDRMDRGVASAKAKEQLDRWLPTVKHNREAEFLTFPLVDPSTTHRVGKDKFVMTNDQPQNDLERELQKIREESGMQSDKPNSGRKGNGGDEEDQLMKAEELAVREMPVEEVMRRRAELRMRRDLLFREERKAKRVAKIKSKSYRRVHRRERAAEEAKAAELREGMSEDEGEREKSDRKRAEQRMSTKHKDSKFAKSMKATNRTVWDEGARDGVNEAARRQEELKRRIAGEDVGDEDEGSDVSDVSSDEGGSDDEERGMLRRLNQLREEGRGIGSQKGVGGMKFMREAEARLRKRNEEDVERLRKEMVGADGEEGEESEGLEGGLGRAIFGPRAKEGGKVVELVRKKRGELEEGSEDEEWGGLGDEGEAGGFVVERGGVRDAKAGAKGILKKPGGNGSGPLAATRDRRDPEASKVVDGGEEGDGVSSWVTGGDEGEEVEAAEETADAVDEQGPMAAAADAQNSKRKGKLSSRAVLDAEPNDEQPTTVSVSAGDTGGWQTVAANDDDQDTDSDSDADDSKPVLTAAEQKSAMHRRAFAGDDVVQAFEAEKAADAAEEDIQESSNYMPGWGSWAGTGLSKSIRKANTKAAHNPLFKTRLPGGGVGVEQRRDKGKDKVIVSERSERKGKKYLAPVLPHGFGRKEEYEGSLRVPVGPEWTTKEVFQRGTRPRVVVRPGSITTAMERPMM
ncbi:hypothetical protein LTR10_003627 [Elasticomyces elasticus]|nr:hypothetical protein LTR10_003627 [Elasticomyces elasticus]KAK4978179.1 hypothetical protein LTR42_002557 [Elasticomyces elasticus]